MEKYRHSLEKSGYADFFGSWGSSTAPMKFQWMRIVCFFVLIPGTFSGLNTSMRSTKARMISASKMQQVYEKGRAGETAANIVKNTTRIPSLSGTASYRIPDGLDFTSKILTEVKNYSGSQNNIGISQMNLKIMDVHKFLHIR